MYPWYRSCLRLVNHSISLCFSFHRVLIITWLLLILCCCHELGWLRCMWRGWLSFLLDQSCIATFCLSWLSLLLFLLCLSCHSIFLIHRGHYCVILICSFCMKWYTVLHWSYLFGLLVYWFDCACCTWQLLDEWFNKLLIWIRFYYSWKSASILLSTLRRWIRLEGCCCGAFLTFFLLGVICTMLRWFRHLMHHGCLLICQVSVRYLTRQDIGSCHVCCHCLMHLATIYTIF